jgi:NAD(P)-dependent dehydrogenase (short-subunit alcohol dehydrogenase family)
MDPINLWVPKKILRATGKSAMPMSIQRVLPGLHHGKSAVITGGSLGIGLQLGRFLAMAGARVLLSARSAEKLAAARDSIVEELSGHRLSGPTGARQRPRRHRRRRRGLLQRLYREAMRSFGRSSTT